MYIHILQEVKYVYPRPIDFVTIICQNLFLEPVANPPTPTQKDEDPDIVRIKKVQAELKIDLLCMYAYYGVPKKRSKIGAAFVLYLLCPPFTKLFFLRSPSKVKPAHFSKLTKENMSKGP